MKDEYCVIVYTKQDGKRDREHVLNFSADTPFQEIFEWLKEIEKAYGATTRLRISKIIH